MRCASKALKNLALSLGLLLPACEGPERPPEKPVAAVSPAPSLPRPGDVQALRDSLVRFRATGDRAKEADALNQLGLVQVVLGDTEAALRSYGEALAIDRQSGDRRAEADVLSNMARAYTVLGKMEDALDFYEQELALRRKFGEVGEEGYCLINLGRIYGSLGDYRNAIDYFNRGLPLLEAGGLQLHAAGALVDLGRALDRTGRTGEGLATIERSLLQQRRLRNPTGEAVALGELGAIHYRLGHRKKARKDYDLEVRILRQVGDRIRESMALPKLGRLQEETGDLRGAARSYSRVLQLSEESGNREYQGLAWMGLARVRRRLGDLNGARQAAENALDRFEALRREPSSRELRASFLAIKQSYYEFHVDLLMELGQQAQAFEVSEQARARSLLDALAQTRADLRGSVEPALLEREADLEDRLNATDRLRLSLTEGGAPPERIEAVERSLRELLLQSERLRDRLHRTAPRYAALGEARPARLETIQRLLDPDTLLLEYALGKERSFLWAVTSSSLAGFELPPRAVIEETARRALFLLASDQRTLARASTDMALAELSRLLLRPVAGRLPRRLVIVGDGPLHTLPFGVLPLPGLADVPLLAEHEVLGLPSASALAALRREPARPGSPVTVAVLADPVFAASDPRLHPGAAAAAAGLRSGRPGRFARLPFAHEEAEAIRELVPAQRYFTAQGFAANRQTVLSGRLKPYRIVHFATHATLDSKVPELSAIALSMVDEQGRPRDGLLRVHDIYRLSIPADLVVLSACDTGLGREVRGEGLIGLTRAFFFAGTRRVLVSLWPVEDRATAELMRRFYREMLQNGQPPAAALRSAQSALRQEPGWREPYYWAGFILQGDWQR